jgi:hypothetical protein
MTGAATTDTGGSVHRLFTSFTLGGSAEVNKKTDRRRGGPPLLFTSFTSFSKEGVMCAGAGARAPRGLTSPPSEEQVNEVNKTPRTRRRLSVSLFTSGFKRKCTEGVRSPLVHFGRWSA